MPQSRIFSWSDIDAETFADIKCQSRVVTGERMQLIWAEFAPDGTYAIHTHPEEQFSVMLQGRMRLTVGEEEREIGPGEMWHAPAGVPHGGVMLGDEPVVFIDVYAPPSESMTHQMARRRAERLGREEGAEAS